MVCLMISQRLFVGNSNIPHSGSFELGELLDGDNIKGSFKDGLLSIEIPKGT